MALITIHHRPFEGRLTTVIAVVLAALIATVLFMAYQASDVSVGSDPASLTPAVDPSLGPNQDLTPAWDMGRSSVEATAKTGAVTVETNRGPNEDLPGVWGIERSPAEADRGPNQDLP